MVRVARLEQFLDDGYSGMGIGSEPLVVASYGEDVL
jgi:hypothetical protein